MSPEPLIDKSRLAQYICFPSMSPDPDMDSLKSLFVFLIPFAKQCHPTLELMRFPDWDYLP